MSNNTTAFVIPTWNSAPYVRKTMDSITNQTVRPDKVIVVDDGSADNTVEVIKQWIKDNPEISTTLIEQINHGPGHARNVGLRQVNDAEFIAFVDSDDELPPQFLEVTRAYLKEHGNASLVTTDIHLFNEKFQEFWEYDTSCLAETPEIEQLVMGSGFLSCSLIRMESVKTIGEFNERLFTGQDSEFFFRLMRVGDWGHVDAGKVRKGGKKEELCRACNDYERRWVLIFEEQLIKAGTSMWNIWDKRLRYLAVRWALSGQQLMKQEKYRDAIYCFVYACLRNPARFWRAGYIFLCLWRGMKKGVVAIFSGRSRVAYRGED